MQLSVEVLDHIFSFLTSHQETLIACSEDPLLSSIVERHLYYHTIVHIGEGTVYSNRYAFEPHHLSRLISENPRIAYHVKILGLEVSWGGFEGALCKFSDTLLMLSALECIVINNPELWPPASLNALVDCLKLPTVKEIHVATNNIFPLSWLDDCKNIQNLSLSGPFNAEDPVSNSPMPQLKSLVLETHCSSSLFARLKPHINKLQSLGCGPESVEILPDLLGLCSGTLTKLEVNLQKSLHFVTTQIIDFLPFPDSPNLQKLTIRAPVNLYYNIDGVLLDCSSYLPAASNIISLFISSGPPRHLALEIHFDLDTRFNLKKKIASLALVDFSPLAVLEAASLSIPHIELYVRTSAGNLTPVLTRAQFLSSLEQYKGVVQSIEDGGLVVHMEKTAPDCITGDWISPSVIRTN